MTKISVAIDDNFGKVLGTEFDQIFTKIFKKSIEISSGVHVMHFYCNERIKK